jgi:hypothetical protein
MLRRPERPDNHTELNDNSSLDDPFIFGQLELPGVKS